MNKCTETCHAITDKWEGVDFENIPDGTLCNCESYRFERYFEHGWYKGTSLSRTEKDYDECIEGQ